MFRNFGILLLLVSLYTISCKKKAKTIQDNIPYQTVNITLRPSDPLYNIATNPPHSGLSQIGGWVYLKGGVNGIIVYRKSQNSSADFVAMERTSTYYPDDANAIAKVQSDNFTLKDSLSGSKWQIIDGALLGGPAIRGLRIYNTLYDNGTGLLTIKN